MGSLHRYQVIEPDFDELARLDIHLPRLLPRLACGIELGAEHVMICLALLQGRRIQRLASHCLGDQDIVYVQLGIRWKMDAQLSRGFVGSIPKVHPGQRSGTDRDLARLRNGMAIANRFGSEGVDVITSGLEGRADEHPPRGVQVGPHTIDVQVSVRRKMDNEGGPIRSRHDIRVFPGWGGGSGSRCGHSNRGRHKPCRDSRAVATVTTAAIVAAAITAVATTAIAAVTTSPTAGAGGIVRVPVAPHATAPAAGATATAAQTAAPAPEATPQTAGATAPATPAAMT